jgi:sugar/nucleoside kinase (ribokinase family)
MSLLVVGSIAYDSIKTPGGEVRDALGGAAVYFSLAASLYSPLRLVGVVGGDFDWEHVKLLESRGVDVAGLEVVPHGKTFRWSGEYSPDMNRRETLSVDLNVFENFQPKIPPSFRDSRYVFLANGSPITQMSVLEQVRHPEFVMADTMDLWIQTQHKALFELLRRIDGIVLNDSEAMLLSERHNLIEAGRAILAMGPSRVLVKKGEHGAILFAGDRIMPLPAYPTAAVRDPTGAGDSFAGGFMGHVARAGKLDDVIIKQAIVHGSVAASFTVEDFGVNRLVALKAEEARRRFDEYCEFLKI